MIRLAVLLSAAVLINGCCSQTGLKDFASDGCTLFPDRSLIFQKDWCGCCFAHDIAYWKGGSEEERLLADTALRDCVIKKTDNKVLADTVYYGVRFGGSPYFYNWYRWGYGWPYARKYKPLTPDEKTAVEKKLEKYYSGHRTPLCKLPPK